MVVPLFEFIRSEGRKHGIEVVGVATNPPRAHGRHSALVKTPVSLWAHQHELPVFEGGECEEFSHLLPDTDLVFVVAYGRIIPQRYLDLPRLGWINLHFSPLPMARGAAPVQRMIAAGVEEIGFTLFRLDEGMDTGPLIYVSPTISIKDLTTGEVWRILIESACSMILDRLKEIEHGANILAQPQYQGPPELALAPKITTAEARIDWHMAAKDIHQRILAFNPSPSAWTHFRKERFLIHRSALVRSDEMLKESLVPGQIMIVSDKVIVGSHKGAIELIEVQPSGKRKMAAKEWLHGTRLSGESFE